MAGRLWAPVVSDLHRQGEVANDLNKIHGTRLWAGSNARSRTNGLSDGLSGGEAVQIRPSGARERGPRGMVMSNDPSDGDL